MPLRVVTPRHEFMNSHPITAPLPHGTGPPLAAGVSVRMSSRGGSGEQVNVPAANEPDEPDEGLRRESRRNQPFVVQSSAAQSTGGALGDMMGESSSPCSRHRVVAQDMIDIGDWNHNQELTFTEATCMLEGSKHQEFGRWMAWRMADGFRQLDYDCGGNLDLDEYDCGILKSK